ncbi:hypothetical protein N185_33200 [Sinorhizobium sp. GW3]|nr:hypothetical protein N185_33200 [Sinorhizobium sp. GW3]
MIALIAGVLRLERTALAEGTIRNYLTGSPRCRLGLGRAVIVVSGIVIMM